MCWWQDGEGWKIHSCWEKCWRWADPMWCLQLQHLAPFCLWTMGDRQALGFTSNNLLFKGEQSVTALLGFNFTCPIIPIVKWKNISKAVLTIHSHSSCIHGFMAKRDMFWSSRVNITISPGTYSFQFCASPLFMAILNICCLLHICLIHRGCLLQLACHFSWAFTIYGERTCIYALLCPSFSTSLHHCHLHSPHSLCHHPSCITKRYTIRFLVFIACTIITLYSSSFMREIPGLGTLRYVEQDGIVIDVKHFRIERCRYLS